MRYLLSHALACRIAKSVAVPRHGCTNALDCSLNGDCLHGLCHCVVPWHGVACETMRFKPATTLQGYGMQPNITSWGGGVLFDGGKYHLYVCVMTNGCPLSAWRENSRIDHAVADDVMGPYVFKDVAVNTWSHNPAPVRLSDGTFALFHIGDGSSIPNGGRSCGSGASHGGGPEEKRVFVISYAENWVVQARERFVDFVDANSVDFADWDIKTLDREGKAVEGPESIARHQFPISIVLIRKVRPGSTIHVSHSLDGPWTPLLPNTLGNCNNPAPWVHANGTIFIVCRGILKRAEHVAGPWSMVTAFSHIGGPASTYEDPYLYVDQRGFHIIYHVYALAERVQCGNATVSAHAFSKDGHAWHVSPVQPFTAQIEVAGSGTVSVSTRERPYFFFDASGQMTHLFSAVCHASQCPSEAPCVNCKYTHWDYTLAQPFDLSPQSSAPSASNGVVRDCKSSIVGYCTTRELKLFASYVGSLTVTTPLSPALDLSKLQAFGGVRNIDGYSTALELRSLALYHGTLVSS